MRLSTAHAKLRWSWSVEARDVAVARSLMEHVLRRDVGTDPEDDAWVAPPARLRCMPAWRADGLAGVPHGGCLPGLAGQAVRRARLPAPAAPAAPRSGADTARARPPAPARSEAAAEQQQQRKRKRRAATQQQREGGDEDGAGPSGAAQQQAAADGDAEMAGEEQQEEEEQAGDYPSKRAAVQQEQQAAAAEEEEVPSTDDEEAQKRLVRCLRRLRRLRCLRCLRLALASWAGRRTGPCPPGTLLPPPPARAPLRALTLRPRPSPARRRATCRPSSAPCWWR